MGREVRLGLVEKVSDDDGGEILGTDTGVGYLSDTAPLSIDMPGIQARPQFGLRDTLGERASIQPEIDVFDSLSTASARLHCCSAESVRRVYFPNQLSREQLCRGIPCPIRASPCTVGRVCSCLSCYRSSKTIDP